MKNTVAKKWARVKSWNWPESKAFWKFRYFHRAFWLSQLQLKRLAARTQVLGKVVSYWRGRKWLGNCKPWWVLVLDSVSFKFYWFRRRNCASGFRWWWWAKNWALWLRCWIFWLSKDNWHSFCFWHSYIGRNCTFRLQIQWRGWKGPIEKIGEKHWWLYQINLISFSIWFINRCFQPRCGLPSRQRPRAEKKWGELKWYSWCCRLFFVERRGKCWRRWQYNWSIGWWWCSSGSRVGSGWFELRK